MNMKSILIEAVLVAQTILFWAIALPAACLLVPLDIVCEKIENLWSRVLIPDLQLLLTHSAAKKPRIAS